MSIDKFFTYILDFKTIKRSIKFIYIFNPYKSYQADKAMMLYDYILGLKQFYYHEPLINFRFKILIKILLIFRSGDLTDDSLFSRTHQPLKKKAVQY